MKKFIILAVSTVTLCILNSCNKTIVDTTYTFDKAIINLGEEYITIKEFGPLKNIENLEIKPFTVLIGESASGKSTLMKLITVSHAGLPLEEPVVKP